MNDSGSQIENHTAIHFRIETEVEVVQCLVGIAEGGEFAPPFQEPV